MRPQSKRDDGFQSVRGGDDSSWRKLEEGPRFLSFLKKEFRRETKIVKKAKVFIRSKILVEEEKYVWKSTQMSSELPAIGAA